MITTLPALRRRFLLPAILCLSAAGVASNVVAEPTVRRQPEHGARDPAGNEFGQGIALSQRYLAVGSDESIDGPETVVGNVKVFDARSGRLIRTFYPPDPNGGFGEAIAISGRRLLIGAQITDLIARGAAYLFDIPTCRQFAKLTSPNPENFDRMGTSVAMDGNYAVVACWGDNGFTGAAFVYDARTGELLHELRADIPGRYFGHCVATCERFALIGAEGDAEGGVDRGSIYLFDLETGEQLRQLYPHDPADYDYFGKEIALNSRFELESGPSTLRSIFFEAPRERTGAFATGGASVEAGEGSLIATRRFDRGENGLVIDRS